MKTELQVRDELSSTRKSINNLRKIYREEKIPKDVYTNKLTDLMATIDTLMWVLGENDRFD